MDVHPTTNTWVLWSTITTFEPDNAKHTLREGDLLLPTRYPDSQRHIQLWWSIEHPHRIVGATHIKCIPFPIVVRKTCSWFQSSKMGKDIRDDGRRGWSPHSCLAPIAGCASLFRVNSVMYSPTHRHKHTMYQCVFGILQCAVSSRRLSPTTPDLLFTIYYIIQLEQRAQHWACVFLYMRRKWWGDDALPREHNNAGVDPSYCEISDLAHTLSRLVKFE